MRHTLTSILATTVLFTACNQPNSSTTTHSDTASVKTTTNISRKLLPDRKGVSSQFIPIDTANKMLLSYLNSINYQQNDSDLHSIIFDANMLRKMLIDPRIANVKIMFAHSLDYINSGGQNINCGYQSKELTVIISGYDNAENYIYSPQNTVLEMGSPCPPGCPTKGSASADLLPVASNNEGK